MASQDDIEKLSQFLQTSLDQSVAQQIASLDQSTGKIHRVFRSQSNPIVTITLRDTEQLPGYEVAYGPDTFTGCMQWTHENLTFTGADLGAIDVGGG